MVPAFCLRTSCYRFYHCLKHQRTALAFLGLFFENYSRAECGNVCAAVVKSHLLSLLAAPQRTALPPLRWAIQLHGVSPPPDIPLGALGAGETD